MKTKQLTEVAKMLAIEDTTEDSVAKRLFSINEILEWLLKTCV